jgi:hypothetical protein
MARDARICQDVAAASTLPDRKAQLPFGTSWSSHGSPVILWQRIMPGWRHALGVEAPVCPGEWSDMWCDETDRLDVGDSVQPRDRLHGGDLRLHLDECRHSSRAGSFPALVRETALRVGVEPRALAVRVLLHLPRVASRNGWVTRWQAQRELRISADRLRRDARAVRNHLPVKRFSLRELTFEVINPSRALPLLTSLHYLRSARQDSLYFALVDPIDKLPVSLCSVSPLEWKCVSNQLQAQFAIRPGGAWDVSRVYSVDGAPANAISVLLSNVRVYFRRNFPSADLLVTVVDPNLGFTGSSYRASNWQQWMTVRARPYLYEYGRHVTPRQLRERYNTTSLIELQGRFPDRFQQSKVRLLDSMIYCCSVNGETKVVPAQEQRRLRR